jgi:3-isopropylmalate/(R)-2-methylmalate dehydratase small subunit
VSNTIKGKVYVLGDDVDTDQIIPAKHLVYSLEDANERLLYGRYALSGVPAEASGLPDGRTPFVLEGKNNSEYQIIVAGRNFGCGSSREHAPFALQMAGIHAVVASSYARIFYRNAVDGGFLVPFEAEKHLVAHFKTGDMAEISEDGRQIRTFTDGSFTLLPLGEVAGIVGAGGLFAYARKQGMLRGKQGRVK